MAHNKSYIEHAGLKIDTQLYQFINEEALPGTGIDAGQCWSSFAHIVENFTPRNRALLRKRVELQNQIDEWHQNNTYELGAYRQFLSDIGYLVEEGEDFNISTTNVDAEICSTAGPQLVVPVNNARYALNAANGRWGSLYDAVYGSDMLRDEYPGSNSGYDPDRGNAVVAYVQAFLDQHIPLQNARHADVSQYKVVDGALSAQTLSGASTLADNTQFVGFTGDVQEPNKLLFQHNGLHIEIVIDREHLIGKQSPAGVCDVQLESALTVIQDCEDSVAAVDAEDKVLVYRNWLGLMQGNLSTSVNKAGRTFERTLAQDRGYQSPTGGENIRLKGRALMLVRNVGHLMTNPAILDSQGDEVFEGLMDAMFTSLIAMHDLRGNSPSKNSSEGSIYIVKPKMHGPEEVAFAVDIFAAVEQALGLNANTLKIGLMDEEKRTTVNLKACIRQAKERLIFINTGFLDRTGDEIHTAMLAGPVVRKADMKTQAWIQAYENWNVDVGLACGLSGKAQIGKGMWAMPDEMAAMVKQKIGHPQSGANCAWVPSPTAATLHAMHYHQVDVWAEQASIAQRRQASLDDLLNLPLADGGWSNEEIQQELDNNCQGILGYVVRWIDQGVGCSKVPDINNIGLMEDRATLRISSQHIANWLYHGIVTEKQVTESLRRMAKIVDQQNAHDSNYHKMATAYQGYAFASAQQLILRGREVINGYTEPMLHAMRRQLKHTDYLEYQVNRPVMHLAF